jgi:hypothetical protein
VSDDLPDLAARLRTVPPSCGPVRLVGVDGHAGSGKSTFSARLAGELGGAPVLHLDDLATHEELFEWMPRLVAQALGPISRGMTAYVEPYDWTARRFLAPHALEPAAVLIIEGVGAGRRALRPHLGRLLWMDRGAAESWQRGRLRDGPEQSVFWDGWTRAERRHLAQDPSRPFADDLVREVPDGYAIRPGPRATAKPNRTLTQGDLDPPPDRTA